MARIYEVYLRDEIYYIDTSVSKITLILQCLKQRNGVSDIFTSEDMENISLISQMLFHMENISCLFFNKTLMNIYVINDNNTRQLTGPPRLALATCGLVLSCK